MEQAIRTRTRQPASGTRTVVQTQDESPAEAVVLRLRPRRRKKVVWKEGTVDNEHMNKKSSKKCCIYEKPRAFDESSSSSSDGSDCDAEHKHRHKRDCPHNHGEGASSGKPRDSDADVGSLQEGTPQNDVVQPSETDDTGGNSVIPFGIRQDSQLRPPTGINGKNEID